MFDVIDGVVIFFVLLGFNEFMYFYVGCIFFSKKM